MSTSIYTVGKVPVKWLTGKMLNVEKLNSS